MLYIIFLSLIAAVGVMLVGITTGRGVFVILAILFYSSFFVIQLPESKTARELKIGILRHAPPHEAERKLLEIAHQRGHKIEIVNPLDLTLDINGIGEYDVIISRAEIDDVSDSIADNYFRSLVYFAHMGIPVINSSSSTLNAQDKFRTLLLAEQAGIPIPDSFVTHNPDQIQGLLDAGKIRYPFVVKGLYGGCGERVFLVEDNLVLDRILDGHFQEGDPILIQERINLERNDSGNFRDMRLWVVRDPRTNRAKFVGGAYRNAQNGGFLTNISAQGNISTMESYDKEVIELSEKALEAINGDVAGIDLVRDLDGNLFLLEVNISFHTSQATEDAIGVNIWEMVMDLAEARAKHQYLSKSSRPNSKFAMRISHKIL